jgi:ACS family hexuronate transporter-like MFS transporter
MVGGFGGMLFTILVGVVAVRGRYAPLFVAIASFDLIGAAVLWVLLREPGRRVRDLGRGPF